MQTVTLAFEKRFSEQPACLVRAPGRVNLIGVHTDYNEGFVLPMAIDRAVWIALRPRPDRCVVVHALDFGESVEFLLDDLQRSRGWAEYIKGMAWAMQDEGLILQGWEGVLAGDVPIDAGLSSSAATEIAVARAFAAISGLAWAPTKMALLGQKAENEWIGLNCGIMDQMVSAAARAGHAFFLDCRSREYEHIPLPPDLAVVVLDTTTRRGLVDSVYNERRAQCEAAARFFGVKSLRDVHADALEAKSKKLEHVVWRRARHVVTENMRVLEAVKALKAREVIRFGQLLYESHASLRDDFEVTDDALNQMVDCASQHPACYGARMTGAGFGGCAVALVRAQAAQDFALSVMVNYQRKTGLRPGVHLCTAAEGTDVIWG